MEMHTEPGIQARTKINPGLQTNNVNTPPAKSRQKNSNSNSMLWEHFTIETVSPGCKRACCKQCKKSYAYITGYKVVGTSHFKRHIAKGGCPVVVGNQNQVSLTPLSAPTKIAHESSPGPTTDPPSVPTVTNALFCKVMHIEPVDLGIQTNNVETPSLKCRKKKSMVWEHFTIETVRPGCKSARCKQCKKSFAYINGYRRVGTSHLKRHIAKDGCTVVVRNQKQDPPTPLCAHESSVGPTTDPPSVPTENNALVNMEMCIEQGIQTDQTQSKRNPGIRKKNVNTRPDKRSKKTSKIWEHFTIETVSPGCKRACCKQCKKSFAYINSYKVVGTSHFKRHITKGGCSVLLRNQDPDPDQDQDQGAPKPLSMMAHESSAAPNPDLPSVPTENNALVIYETPIEPDDLGIQTNNVETPPAKRRKKVSMVWKHFTIETVSPGCRRACCKQCKQSFAYSMGSKVAGTSHLKRHIAKDGCLVAIRNQNQNPLTPLSAPSTMAHESSAKGPIERPTYDERLVSLEAEVRRLGEELREVKRVIQAVREEAPSRDQP